MEYSKIIKEVGRGKNHARDLDEETARALYARVLYERQTEMAAEAVVLPTSKDPEVTARWIERCVAGVEPVPNSLKIQLACCLLACGEVTSLEQGLSRVNDCW